MAVIPRDDGQMPPRAASPGLPPVDPVKGRCSPPSWIGEPTRSAASTGEAGRMTDSRPAARLTNGPGTRCDDFFEFADAGEDAGADPFGSFPQTVVRADVQADAVVLPGTVFHPRDGDVDGYPGRGETSPAGDVERVSAILEGSHAPFMQAVDPVRESADTTKLGALDSLGEAVSSCATAGVRRRVPARIAARPDPTQWSDDELLTLPEAAALFWPDGPITTNTLRTAGRDGALAITKVAGKFFTTPMAIRRMGLDEVGAPARLERVDPTEGSPQALFLMKLAEAKRLGRERARPGRAAKRSVAPVVKSGRAGQ